MCLAPFVTSESRQEEDFGICEALWDIRKIQLSNPSFWRKLVWSFRHPLLPFTASRFCEGASQLRALLREEHWDLVVFDGLHMAAAFSFFGLFQKPAIEAKIVYRAHNVESQIWGRLARRKSGVLSMLLKTQEILMKRLEGSVVRSSDCCLPVSRTDGTLFQSFYGSNDFRGTPVGYDFSGPLLEMTSLGLNLLFVGRLDWRPNREGLEWFLERVWPRVREERPDIELKIVGVGDSSWLPSEMAGVKVLGYVDDLRPVYEESHLCIAPLFFGSGTRVKIIEAASYGRGTLSTTIGFEGLEIGESLLAFIQKDTESAWVEALLGVKRGDCSRWGTTLYTSLRARHDPKVAAAPFLSWIQDTFMVTPSSS